jgi:hypothetical protein
MNFVPKAAITTLTPTPSLSRGGGMGEGGATHVAVPIKND